MASSNWGVVRRLCRGALAALALTAWPLVAHAGYDFECVQKTVLQHPPSGAVDMPLNVIVTPIEPRAAMSLQAEADAALDLLPVRLGNLCFGQPPATVSWPFFSRELLPNTRYTSPDDPSFSFTTGSTTDMEPPVVSVGADEDSGFGFRAPLSGAYDVVFLVVQAYIGGAEVFFATSPLDGAIDLSDEHIADGKTLTISAFDAGGNRVSLTAKSKAPAEEQGCSTARGRNGTSTPAWLALAVLLFGTVRRRQA